jgi:REP element-mobilizing transposase RayT
VDFAAIQRKISCSPNFLIAMYRRNLPHWHPPGATLFATWCLADPEFRWLERPEIAECVVTQLLDGDDTDYQLHAFVVMPDHVHMLLTPWSELATITRGIKGRSARQSNLLLGRTSHAFWQDESFDHWLRHSDNFESALLYIERNPVRAGLVEEARQWPYSGATDHRLKPVARMKK